MKKTKIIIPALGMLLLSTAASVTGTVAWFSMNNFVNATQMKVTAKAESGIVISNQAAASGTGVTWKETAQSTHNDPLAVYPTSTANASTWVHSKSTDSDDNNTDQAYELLDLDDDASTGAGYVESNSVANYQATGTAGTKWTQEEIDQAQEGDPAYNKTTDDWKTEPVEAESAYYLMNSFYIKSSATRITGSTLYVTKVIGTITGSSVSEDLNLALRVLVKLNSGDADADNATAKVFAPFRTADYPYQVVTAIGATNNYTNNTKTNVNAVAPDANNIVNTSFLTGQTIPASSETPLRIDIYLYYEGEDEECKSANLTATLDQLNVQVEFGTTQRQ